jgi:exodeoxyribonuclease VII small subunit
MRFGSSTWSSDANGRRIVPGKCCRDGLRGASGRRCSTIVTAPRSARLDAASTDHQGGQEAFIVSEIPNDAAETATFEQALERMEAIVRDLEEGRIGLAEAMQKYEQGVKLLRQCYGVLEAAEQRIELLTGVDADGRAVTKPFEHTDSATQAAQDQPRSRRRSTARKEPATETPTDDDTPQLF